MAGDYTSNLASMFSPRPNTIDMPVTGNEHTGENLYRAFHLEGHRWHSSPSASNTSNATSSIAHDRTSLGLQLASKLENLVIYMEQNASHLPTNIRDLDRAVDRALKVIADRSSSLADLEVVEKAVDDALLEISDDPPSRRGSKALELHRGSTGRRGSRRLSQHVGDRSLPEQISSPPARSDEGWVLITEPAPRRRSSELSPTSIRMVSRSKNVSSPDAGKATTYTPAPFTSIINAPRSPNPSIPETRGKPFNYPPNYHRFYLPFPPDTQHAGHASTPTH